jgi:hypothetical protein
MSTLNVGNINTNSVNDGQLAGFRNRIINGNFALNQRGYSSGSSLSSGVYAHDRWKAGASDGDYSFTQSANGCTITIAATKTLVQVIEDANIEGGTYVLSWTGTAQARYGVDTATPSGAYADSPIIITGQSASTTMSVEFDDGTLSNVQLEPGSTATTFEQRPYGTELALCKRYFQRVDAPTDTAFIFPGQAYQTSASIFGVRFTDEMRVAPTITLGTAGIGAGAIYAAKGDSNIPTTAGTAAAGTITVSGFRVLFTGWTSAFTVGAASHWCARGPCNVYKADAEL